jgi:hypothetical protein
MAQAFGDAPGVFGADTADLEVLALTKEDLQLIEESLSLLAYELSALEASGKSSKTLSERADIIRGKVHLLQQQLKAGRARD